MEEVFIRVVNLEEAEEEEDELDLHFEFNYATEEQIMKMWNNFYPPLSKEEKAKDLSKDRLVKELNEKNLSITTSALQHFFVNQMESSAEEALNAVPSIIEDIIRNSSKSLLDSATNAEEIEGNAENENDAKGKGKGKMRSCQRKIWKWLRNYYLF